MMRRADRLFEIIQYLRGRKITTARWLAEKLEVSERTIYRDIQDLMATGVPIDGEAGIGYLLRKGYDLPPLMFDHDELCALVLGARMVAALGGKMQDHAQRALSKIDAVLPRQPQKSFDHVPLYAPNTALLPLGNTIDQFNQAIKLKQIVSLTYLKPSHEFPTTRQIYPLGLFFWQARWTVVAWCTLQSDFRQFRLDRIQHITLTSTPFNLAPHQTLNHYLSSITKNTFRLKKD